MLLRNVRIDSYLAVVIYDFYYRSSCCYAPIPITLISVAWSLLWWRSATVILLLTIIALDLLRGN